MTFKRILAGLVILALVGVAAFWVITQPHTLAASALAADYKPDLANGETLFNIGGCVSCHQSAGQDDRLKLGGGRPLTSPFGTFYPPNISPDPVHGIGKWTELEFVNAMKRGVGPDGEHLYPALPYTSYQRMPVKDVRDIFAYLKTLAPQPDASKPHDLSFPFTIRRLLGGWKLLFLDEHRFKSDPSKSAEWNRGAYLVEGPGHCAECHSPRDAFGGIEASRRFAGGPNPDGHGWVPNITQHTDGIGDWSKDQIADFLKSGFTPDFDSAGGSMAEVIQNTSLLTDADRAAMAAYLKSLPAIAGKSPGKS